MAAGPATFALGPDRDRAVLVASGGRVAAFGPASARHPVGEADCRGCRILPGGVNAHTHIYSGLAPLGLPAPQPPPESFLEILERVWWRLDRALDEASLRASARYYAAESLLAGVTTLVDHHESPSLIEGSLDILADACQEVGIRAVLAFGATERNGGPGEAHRGLAECRRFIRSNHRPLVRGVVGLHASFTVSDETVRAAGALCRELGTVMHVHVAEDAADVEDARRRGYPGPLERLLELGALPPGSILAHGVHCSREQVRLADQHGLWFVHNPRSNRGNRVGYAAALTAGTRVALGTDGYPSRLEDEAAALFEEAAAHGQPAAEVAPRLAGGHRLAAERLGGRLAPLAPGGLADAVAADADGARHVAVAGRLVVADRELLYADLAEIHAEAERQAPRMWQRMAELAAE